MYAYDEIRHVHLEPTTHCNARCPMCARNVCGVTAPGLHLAHLSLADFRTIFPDELLSRLRGFDMCGAYGDPAMARDLLEITAHIRAASPACSISLYTNGSIRSRAWWKRYAEVLGDTGRVVFALDGLGETNGVYRRGVNFDKAIANARAFIAAGGDARWDFLAFRHNEHQVDAARALSEELGFEEFSVKKTDRFLEPEYDYVPEAQADYAPDRFPIYERDGTVVGHLEPPEAPELVNETALRRNDLLQRYGSLDELFDRTPIHCRVLDTNSVFVSAEGFAFPCCWTYVQATRPELAGFPAGVQLQVRECVEQSGGFDALDTRALGLRAVVEGELFRAIEASWSCGSVAEGRLKVCARACGVDFPAYFDQFHEPGMQPRSLRLQQVSRSG
jgi:MoaA/NifB/PqqE/SkfB family radical SAM enzyme